MDEIQKNLDAENGICYWCPKCEYVPTWRELHSGVCPDCRQSESND